MGTPWSARLPVLQIAQGDEGKAFTLIVPYYDNPKFLARQIAHWEAMPTELQPFFKVIVVDDGSPKPAADVVSGRPVSCALRLFRIEQDVRWNWLAARNIGAHHADEGWLLFTDMDHMVPASTVRRIVYGQHRPNTVYAFRRVEHTGAEATPHSASLLMTRAKFWEIGGYDERGSGFYGNDGPFRRRVAQHAPIAVLTDHLVRHEYVEDSSTTTYKRKQPEDAGLRKLMATWPAGSPPKTLSFPYHEVGL